MRVLFLGLSTFCLAFIMHLIIWRIRLPNNQMKALAGIFFGTLGICLAFLWFILPRIDAALAFVLVGIPEYLHMILLFVSLAAVYIMTYSAIEADSPSLVMIMAIAKAHPEGLNKEKLFEEMTDDLLVKPRIEDLVGAKLAYIKGNKYKITLRGTLFLFPFILYRRFLNIPKGG